jgi:hypothetical protein
MDRPLAIALTELKRGPYVRHMYVRALYASMNSGLRHTAHHINRKQAHQMHVQRTHAAFIISTRRILIRRLNAWKSRAFIHATGMCSMCCMHSGTWHASTSRTCCMHKQRMQHFTLHSNYCKPNKCTRNIIFVFFTILVTSNKLLWIT